MRTNEKGESHKKKDRKKKSVKMVGLLVLVVVVAVVAPVVVATAATAVIIIVVVKNIQKQMEYLQNHHLKKEKGWKQEKKEDTFILQETILHRQGTECP